MNRKDVKTGRESLTFFFKNFDEWYFLEINHVTAFFFLKANIRSKSYLAMVSTGGEYAFDEKYNNVI